MKIFFDIETAPEVNYEDLSEGKKSIRIDRYCKKMAEGDTEEGHYYRTAGLYAEYSKAICISGGYFHPSDQKLEVTSFSEGSEKQIIEEFFAKINGKHVLAGYNIKGFDMAFLCKRAVILGIKEIPTNINHAGKKPWLIDADDVMERRKFGGNMGASLGLACEAVGIESPKGEVQGNMMGAYYHSDEFDLKKVVKYCEKDVKATMRLYEKLKGY